MENKKNKEQKTSKKINKIPDNRYFDYKRKSLFEGSKKQFEELVGEIVSY